MNDLGYTTDMLCRNDRARVNLDVPFPSPTGSGRIVGRLGQFLAPGANFTVWFEWLLQGATDIELAEPRARQRGSVLGC